MATQGSPSRSFVYGLVTFSPAAIALFLLGLAVFQPVSSLLVPLAALSLATTASHWLFLKPRAIFFVSFLPAIPLAIAALFLLGGSGQPRLLVATAVAFETRRWLLLLARRCDRQRVQCAEALERREALNATVYVDNDIESEVEASMLREGHLFRLGPGQICPADGLVTYGSSFVDECLIADQTEELQAKGMGSRISAGSLNKNGSMLVKATAVNGQTFNARLAQRIRNGQELLPARVLAVDAAFTLFAATLSAISGPEAIVRSLLVASGAGCLALLARFEAELGQIAVHRRWLWSPGALSKFSKAGMLILSPKGILQQGRPRLLAIESLEPLSHDAALGLLAPLARKIESPAAFALLQELRIRNIPLQQPEFFQFQPEGGLAFIDGEEVRWIQLEAKSDALALGPLETFVNEHQGAGDEICLLERDGSIQAAVAFRDTPIANLRESVDVLRSLSLPILLLSSQTKRFVSRLQTELNLEHAQGESSIADTEYLFEKLSEEKLAPAWIKTGSFVPKHAWAVASLPFPGEAADLLLTDLSLPQLADALQFGQKALHILRFSLRVAFSLQLGILILLALTNPKLAAWLHLGSGWVINDLALAILGALPGFIGFLFLSIPTQPLQPPR